MSSFMPWHHFGELALAGIAAAMLSAVLIVGLMPLLQRYALARPNARSSHAVPTPQGGGIAVVTATLIATAVSIGVTPELGAGMSWQLALLFCAVVALAIVGCIDDIWVVEVLPRLVFQFVAVTAVIVALPGELQIFPALPPWLERAAAVFVGVWFVNLVNFMDGIDWITVAETLAITLGAILISLIASLPPTSIVIALTLLGATLGFAPFNRPVARLFLGDVGSLPIGLLLFWLLLQVAASGFVAAAILLPLYYLADATVTLLRRMVNGERFVEAHRSHYYQRAIQGGYSVREVVARVAVVNAALLVLALLSVRIHTVAFDIAALLLGAAIVTGLLISLSRGKT